jgi:hypothetical protein
VGRAGGAYHGCDGHCSGGLGGNVGAGGGEPGTRKGSASGGIAGGGAGVVGAGDGGGASGGPAGGDQCGALPPPGGTGNPEGAGCGAVGSLMRVQSSEHHATTPMSRSGFSGCGR